MIVQVKYQGLIGLGEATANRYYGATVETLKSTLESVAPKLRDYRLENPADLWQELDSELNHCRFAQCALDCAVWDLFAQMHNMPLWQLWGFRSDDPYPPSCYTLGIDRPEVMLQKMQAMPGWPVYKIKLNGKDDISLVRTLRENTDARFQVDANCSWEPSMVVPRAEQLAALNVELIEQPLAAEEFGPMQSLKGKCALPIMADESCQFETDVDRCLRAFDAINVKLLKCGGLTPARRMIARAKQRGLRVMVGCMTQSSVGIAAGVHLLPLLDFADLDGALLLQDDIAQGLEWHQGICKLPTEPGLGIRLN